MANTPNNLLELGNLLSRIEHKSSSLRIGASSAQTLRYMIENPAFTAISTMTNIAKVNNVNPSTLTRLAYSLGFDKFSNLQQLFHDHIEDNAQYYSHRANRLLNRQQKNLASDSIFDTIIEEEIQNIRSLLPSTNFKTFQHIVDLFIHSRKIRFFGRRQFFSLATFFAYCLGLIRESVDIMQDDVHGLSHSLTFMGEKDLIAILGCSPYTRATVETCRIAHANKIPLVAITDNPDSPLARYAKHSLFIPVESHFYSNSMTAAFALAEGILAMTAQQMGSATLDTLKKREQIIEQFGTVLTNNNPAKQ